MHYTVYHVTTASVASGKPFKICGHSYYQFKIAGFLHLTQFEFHSALIVSDEASDVKGPTTSTHIRQFHIVSTSFVFSQSK